MKAPMDNSAQYGDPQAEQVSAERPEAKRSPLVDRLKREAEHMEDGAYTYRHATTVTAALLREAAAALAAPSVAPPDTALALAYECGYTAGIADAAPPAQSMEPDAYERCAQIADEFADLQNSHPSPAEARKHCARSACRKVLRHPDEWWNTGSRDWYCGRCAGQINEGMPRLCIPAASLPHATAPASTAWNEAEFDQLVLALEGFVSDRSTCSDELPGDTYEEWDAAVAAARNALRAYVLSHVRSQQ